MNDIKYLKDFYFKLEGYKNNLLPLNICDKYLLPNEHIYVEKNTGIICSARDSSEKEILDLWNDQVYKDKSLSTGYDSNYPYAQARIKYVIDTCYEFLKKKIQPQSICDFAAGTGGAIDSLKSKFKDSTLYATEGSLDNTNLLNQIGYDSCSNVMLGKSLRKDNLLNKNFPVDLGFLTWTLCNCINPLDVLYDISDNIKENGYICVAESSRILIPAFRKSITDYLSKSNNPDLHPFHWTFNSLSNVIKLAGFKIEFVNRFIDNDVMMIVARKTKNFKYEIIKDNYENVIEFFNQWSDLEDKLFKEYRYEKYL